MSENYFRTKIDIKRKKMGWNPKIVQYDKVRLEFEVVDNGAPFDLTTFNRVEFVHQRPNGTAVKYDGLLVTEGNTKIVRYDYQGSEMDFPGRVETSFSLYDTSNKKVSMPAFIITVDDDLLEGAGAVEPSKGIIRTLIEDVEDLKLNGGGGGGGGSTPLVNNLTSTSTTSALTAAQGKVLNDAQTSHVGNSNIHVTAANKTDWNAKETTSGSQTKVNNHAAVVATTSAIGHVKPDGTTITVDGSGTIKAVGGTGTVPDASTTTKGIVQLNNTLTSTSTTQAVTAAQAKVVNDALTSHTNDANIHVTTTKKNEWDAKETTTGSQAKVTAHASAVATTNALGHVKPDGVTITIDNAGVITAVGGGGGGGSVEAHTHTTSQIINLDSTLSAKAPLASPGFTGTPTGPTPTAGTNTTQLATTAFVTTAVTNKTSVTGNAGSATKLETARTINGVAFDGTANITVADNTKAPLASPTLTGTPTAPTASTGTNTTQLATTAFTKNTVDAHTTTVATTNALGHVKPDGTTITVDNNGVITAVGGGGGGTGAPLNSPSFTGTPTAPTAVTGTSTTQLATTAFVNNSVDTHKNDYLPHDTGFSQYSSDPDANGFYRVVEYRRPLLNYLYLKSTASNPDAAGRYQTITWQFYNGLGTAIASTKVWTLTYDTNGVIVSKVIS